MGGLFITVVWFVAKMLFSFLDVGIYGWPLTVMDCTQNIPWRTAAYGESALVGNPVAIRLMHRESFVIQHS